MLWLLMTSWYHFNKEWNDSMMKMLISLPDSKTITNGPPTHTKNVSSENGVTMLQYFQADDKESNWLQVPLGYSHWLKVTSTIGMSEQLSHMLSFKMRYLLPFCILLIPTKESLFHRLLAWISFGRKIDTKHARVFKLYWNDVTDTVKLSTSSLITETTLNNRNLFHLEMLLG